MARMTIDYGIDLGTTNSAIAVMNGVEPEVIRDDNNAEYIPSVIHIDKGGGVAVGRFAYDRLYKDPENTHAEFKRRVGNNTSYAFARSGRTMTAEELSAEVLKELKKAVSERRGEELQAAVISVPADFALPENEGTRQAATLAGLLHTPLVQEPVAAALAYGFQDNKSKAYWLVFDLGGGTFDAAIMHVRDGIIQVVGHAGDQQLGGKDVDWAIVERLLVPEILATYPMEEFHRENPKWMTPFAKLKYEAEKAKILLSRSRTATVEVDNLFIESDRAPVVFERDITRDEIQEILEPTVTRAIDICRRALKECNLAPGDIEKLILVGGPTKTPYLRERLRDTDNGLGIPLEFSIDPMTVVAQGAAVFASSQRWEASQAEPRPAGTFRLRLEFKPVGSDRDPLVGGVVTSDDGSSLEGYEIEIASTTKKQGWRSGKIRLATDGTFTANLSADPGVRNNFKVTLWDPSGGRKALEPSEFPYTIGLTVTDPPLTHSVGIAQADGTSAWFIQKGTPLPAKGKHVLRTTVDIKKGKAGQAIRIPVIEGTYPIAERNREVGHLLVEFDRPSRDLPLGSEVEVTIAIDRDRMVHGEAYIPLVDRQVDAILKLQAPPPDPDQLRLRLTKLRSRLAETRQQAEKHDNGEATEILETIDRQGLVGQVADTLQTAKPGDEDIEKVDSRLGEMEAELDRAGAVLDRPALHTEAAERITWARKLLDEVGSSRAKQRLAELEAEVQRCIDANDDDALRRKVEEVNALGYSVLLEQPAFWVGYLEHLKEKLPLMSDQPRAQDLIRRGGRAIQENDLDALRAVVRQLMSLLPQEAQAEAEKAFGSTVIQ